MITFLFCLLALLMLLTAFSVVRGIAKMGKATQSQKFMRWRVLAQAGALLIFAILLKLLK